MATVVNDRDVLIMGTSPRFTPPTDRGMFITPSSAVFKVSTDGSTASPASFTFAVTLLNMTGAVAFSFSGGMTPTVSGNQVTLTYANMSAVSGTITATISVDGQLYTAIATVTKVADGTNGTTAITGFLTNESTTLAATSAGVISDFSPASGTFKLYDGVTDKTGASVTYSVLSQTGCAATITAAGVYSVSLMTADSATAVLQAVYGGVTIQKTLTLAKARAGVNAPPAAYVVVSTTGQVFSRATSAAAFAPTSLTLTATPYGGAATYQWQYWTGSAWTNVASAGTAATYAVASGDFTDARTYRVQATISGTVFTDEITLIQVTGGTSGANAISGFLTNESVTLAATNAGVVSDFSPAAGTFKIYDGITDKTGTSVTYSVFSETGCDASITTAGAYSVASMTADTATAVLQAVYGGVTVQKTLTLAKAKAGNVGAAATYVVVSNNGQVFSRADSTVSFAPASITLTATPYGGAATYQWQYWTGSAWTNVATGGTAANYTVASSDFSGTRTYRVQATIGGVVYTDEQTIVQVTGGANGIRGNVDIAAVTTGSVWSDSEAVAALAAAGYGAPQVRDMVTLYKSDRTFGVQKMYNGTAWVAVDYVWNGNVFVKGSILPESIDTRGLAIKDASGNVILGAGTSLPTTYLPAGALNSNVSIGNNGALTGGGGGQVTIGGLGYTGALNATYGATIGANLGGQMTSANISTYIAAAAIGLALIDKASIGSLSALTATIGTLRTSTSGARTEISDNVIKVFDTSNQLRVRMGDLSL